MSHIYNDPVDGFRISRNKATCMAAFSVVAGLGVLFFPQFLANPPDEKTLFSSYKKQSIERQIANQVNPLASRVVNDVLARDDGGKSGTVTYVLRPSSTEGMTVVVDIGKAHGEAAERVAETRKEEIKADQMILWSSRLYGLTALAFAAFALRQHLKLGRIQGGIDSAPSPRP